MTCTAAQQSVYLPTATTQYGPIEMALRTLPRITPFTWSHEGRAGVGTGIVCHDMCVCLWVCAWIGALLH